MNNASILRMHFFQILIYSLLILLTSNSWSKEVLLNQVVNEEKMLELDDTIILDEQNTASFKKFLGKGNTTRVYEVIYNGETQALRVPKSQGRFNTFSKYGDYIDAFYLGHNALDVQGVNIPKIEKYKAQRYLIVEKLNLENSFELKDFFFNKDNIDSAIYNDAKEKLVEFMVEISSFKEIKDFHLGQVAYSPKDKKWILIDWTLNHELFSELQDKFPFHKKLLQDIWSERFFYMKGGDKNKEISRDLKLNQSDKELLEEIELTVHAHREETLSNEIELIKTLQNKINNSITPNEFLDAIQAPSKRFSQNYIDKLLELIGEQTKFTVKEISSGIPYYIISNNRDFQNLLIKLLKDVTSVEELVMLLEMRQVIGIKSNWNLTMMIQDIIKNSPMDTEREHYLKLLDHELVSNFARAWIKRERLGIDPTMNCKSAIKMFMK